MAEASGSGSIPLTRWIRIRIQEAQKHTDPTDPNPQHCCKVMLRRSPVLWIRIRSDLGLFGLVGYVSGPFLTRIRVQTQEPTYQGKWTLIPGFFWPWIRNLGWKISDPGSGINIPDIWNRSWWQLPHISRFTCTFFQTLIALKVRCFWTWLKFSWFTKICRKVCKKTYFSPK